MKRPERDHKRIQIFVHFVELQKAYPPLLLKSFKLWIKHVPEVQKFAEISVVDGVSNFAPKIITEN